MVKTKGFDAPVKDTASILGKRRELALLFGLPENFYYQYSEREWSRAEKTFGYLYGQMSRHIVKFKAWADPVYLESICQGKHLSEIPYSVWAKEFLRYREAVNNPIVPYINRAIKFEEILRPRKEEATYG